MHISTYGMFRASLDRIETICFAIKRLKATEHQRVINTRILLNDILLYLFVTIVFYSSLQCYNSLFNWLVGMGSKRRQSESDSQHEAKESL